MRRYKFRYELPRASDENKKEMKSRILRPNPRPYAFAEYVPEYHYINDVSDYFSTMGSNPNERPTPPPHYDKRTIYIDNGSDIPVSIGINNSPYEAPEKILFTLQPEEGRYVLINSYGGSPQYLWPFYSEGVVKMIPRASDLQYYSKNDEKCRIAGRPRIIANNANSYVLKRGVEGVWIITFQYPTPRGAS